MPVDEVLGRAGEAHGRAGETRGHAGETDGHAGETDGHAGETDGRTRRELLIGAGGLAAGATLARSPAAALAFRINKLQAHPRIAIVGAGLAGLRCAHMLWTQSPGDPVPAAVYEANPDRAGGRCWTLRDYFAGGLITEHGGSFLNSDQTAIRKLASRLGLKQVVVNGGDLLHGDEVFFIDGRMYTYAEANADWHDVGFPAFRKAAHEMNTAAGTARLDRMSVPEWLDSTEIGADSRFGKLMMADTVTENGGDPDDQSALDLIVLLTGNPRSSLYPLPGDDERYTIVGGNDQLVSGMIGDLPPGTVRHGHVLVAIREHADQTIGLVFDVGGKSVEKTADLVVLALPFSTLRHVDLSRSGLSRDQAPRDRDDGHGDERQDPSRAEPQDLAGARLQRRHLRRVAAPGVRMGRHRPARPRRQPRAVPGLPGRTRRSHGPHRRRARHRAGARRPLGARADRAPVPRHDRRLHRPRLRGPLVARPVGARRLLLLPSAVRPRTTASSPAPPTAASCSPASTPRSTTSASSTVPSRPASAPPGGCSAASASEP